MGWTQVLTITPHDGTSCRQEIDRAPADDAHAPAVFSYLPRLFDAPGPNPPRKNELWKAESYLLICPDVARSRSVAPLLGIQWGYDLVNSKPSVLPVEILSEDDWRRAAAIYRRECPGWEISERFHRDI